MGINITALIKDAKSQTGLCVRAELGKGPPQRFDPFVVKSGGEYNR